MAFEMLPFAVNVVFLCGFIYFIYVNSTNTLLFFLFFE